MEPVPPVHMKRYEWVVRVRRVFKAQHIRGHNDLAMLITEFIHGFYPYAWIKTLRRISYSPDVWIKCGYVPLPPHMQSSRHHAYWYEHEDGRGHIIVGYSSYAGVNNVATAWIDYTDNTIKFTALFAPESYGRLCVAHEIIHSPRAFLNMLQPAIDWYGSIRMPSRKELDQEVTHAP